MCLTAPVRERARLPLPLELHRPGADAVLVGDRVPASPSPLPSSPRASCRLKLTQHTQHLIALTVGKLSQRGGRDPSVLGQEPLELPRGDDLTRPSRRSPSPSPDGRRIAHCWLRQAGAVALQLITSGLKKSNLSMQHVEPVLNRLR